MKLLKITGISDSFKSSQILIISFCLFFGHIQPHIGEVEAGEVRGCLESFLYHQVAGHVHVVRPPGRSCKLFIEKILSWDVIVIVINITVKESSSHDEQCQLSFGF